MSGPHTGPSQPAPGPPEVRPLLRSAVAAVVGAGAGVTGAWLLFATDEQGPAGAALGLAAVSLGVALAIVAKHVLPPPDAQEERHAPGGAGTEGDEGPLVSPPRRRLIVGGSLAAAAGLGVGGTALLRGSTDARAELRGTKWRDGDALVTTDGREVFAGDLSVGAMLTVWPEGAVGAADSQAVLLRLDPARLAASAQRSEWVPDGHVAYSKLCTHMGCPVGLFQQDPEALVCPCHQAVFDVLDGARPVQGPAKRPLPQLPLAIGDDGALRAGGDFNDAVGPGWWDRP